MIKKQGADIRREIPQVIRAESMCERIQVLE